MQQRQQVIRRSSMSAAGFSTPRAVNNSTVELDTPACKVSIGANEFELDAVYGPTSTQQDMFVCNKFVIIIF